MTRLPVLDLRGIPAVAVAGTSARIGDGRSLWVSGVVAHVNRAAARAGARPGLPAREFARAAART